ncbi:MAG: hypothetical protein ACXVQJ_09985 [Actinomycetota bacterium]
MLRPLRRLAVSSATIALLVAPTFLGSPVSAASGGAVHAGALPKDATKLDALKTAADAKSASLSGTSVGLKPSPGGNVAFEGTYDPRWTPPDTIAAAGTTRIVLTVNTRYGIYDRTGAVLSEGNLQDLTPGVSDACGGDPQVLWDAGTSRFYVTNTDFCTGRIGVAYSLTASPNSAADWCSSVVDFFGASTFVDYQKLGDTADYLLIGANIYSGQVEADLMWLPKPAAGSGCVDLGAGTHGVVGPLAYGDGQPAFTPVPANQIDPSSTGYVVAAADPYTYKQPDFLAVWTVTKGAGGAPVVSAARDVAVPSYDVPSSARQLGTNKKIDTMDTRLWQVVAAVDPRYGTTALWTQHTVFGGEGAEVRWYEVGASSGSVLQLGAVTDPGGWVFNGAISPDRVVRGTTRAFGSDMVLGFNTSSTTAYPAIGMVSKRGANPQTAPVLVKQSPGFDADYSCNKYCRWGDYASATPDPAAPVRHATVGAVWLGNQWNVASTSKAADWRTWIWRARP